MTRSVAEHMARPTVTAARSRLGALAVSHLVVDVYAAFVPPLLGLLEVRCHLSAAETAWLLGLGSLSSGLSQPLSAWVSDRTDSRVLGAIGLAVAAVCLSCIGLAQSFGPLALLYATGMIGIGMYHPVGAATMGQLAAQLPRASRSLGLSVFFVAGMAGGVTGAMIASRAGTLPGGLDLLRWCMIPGLLLAIVLHVAIGRVPHRHEGHRELTFSRREMHRRWTAVALIYVSNVIRFTVNIAMLYLFVRWTQTPLAATHTEWSERDIAEAAAPMIGDLNALLIVGMAVGGLFAGALVRPGREKVPLVLVPIAMAPAVAVFGLVEGRMGYLLAVLGGAGFASMVPVTLSLAQRLLPHRTSLASGLMLGGAWGLAIAGPALAEFCLSTLGLSVGATFGLTALLLVAAGLICLPLKTELLRETAAPDDDGAGDEGLCIVR